MNMSATTTFALATEVLANALDVGPRYWIASNGAFFSRRSSAPENARDMRAQPMEQRVNRTFQKRNRAVADGSGST